MEKTRIMIVEADAHLAILMKGVLSLLGYGICKLFTSGEEAMKQIEQEKPDIIMMDIDLDNVPGKIEATNRIRSCCNLPIIFLTTNQDKERKVLAKIVEPSGCFIKLVKCKNLKLEIDNILF